MVLHIVQDLVSRAGRPVPVNALDILRHVECALQHLLMLIGLRELLINERARLESRVAEVSRSEGCTHAAEEESEALSVARARVNKLRAERASLKSWTKQEKVDRDTFANLISELESAAASQDVQLGLVVRALWSLDDCVAAGENRPNTTDVWP